MSEFSTVELCENFVSKPPPECNEHVTAATLTVSLVLSRRCIVLRTGLGRFAAVTAL